MLVNPGSSQSPAIVALEGLCQPPKFAAPSGDHVVVLVKIVQQGERAAFAWEQLGQRFGNDCMCLSHSVAGLQHVTHGIEQTHLPVVLLQPADHATELGVGNSDTLLGLGGHTSTE